VQRVTARRAQGSRRARHPAGARAGAQRSAGPVGGLAGGPPGARLPVDLHRAHRQAVVGWVGGQQDAGGAGAHLEGDVGGQRICAPRDRRPDRRRVLQEARRRLRFRCPSAAGQRRRRRRRPVPKMLRVISRPITVPAERIALLNARLSTTLSSWPGPCGSTGAGTVWVCAGSGGASQATSGAKTAARSLVWPYSASRGLDLAAAAIATSPMVSISERGARIRVRATGVGAPFSESTVTTASPMPSDVSVDSRS